MYKSVREKSKQIASADGADESQVEEKLLNFYYKWSSES